MDRFVEAGITTFDCADIYTGVEALIGEWLKRRNASRCRATVQVHTKYVPDLDRLPTHSRADVVRGVDRSLARLGVERIDLVQLHWWDYDVPGYVDAAVWLDELRRAGKIRHVGVTNFDQQRLRTSSRPAYRSRRIRCSIRCSTGPAAGRMAAECARPRHRTALLRCAGRGIPLRAVSRPARSRTSARQSLAREVPPDHRRVRRMGAFPGSARRARRIASHATAGHRRGRDPLGPRSAGRVRRDRRRSPRAAYRPDPGSVRADARRRGPGSLARASLLQRVPGATFTTSSA